MTRQGFLKLSLVVVLAFEFHATLQAQTIGLNFTGTTRSESGFIPPDTMGTVGNDHIIEMINGRYVVYDKTDGSELTNTTLNSFWADAGAPHTGSFSFDPRVQYDPFSERFYACSVDNPSNANNIMFAVSNSSNPLDGWTGFSVDSDSDDAQWADFPQMGFSRDQIVISNNMFATGSGPFEQNMLIIPKADILGGTPTLANATLLESQRANTGGGFSLQAPIDLDNSSQPLRLFSNSAGGAGALATIEIGGTLSSPVIDNIADVTGLTAYGSPPTADQPGTAPNLDSGGDRTRSALTLIGGKLYGIHGAENPDTGKAALQWYRLDADTLALEAEGLIADEDLDLIYGSISANESGDIVVGFTGSSDTQFASAYAVVGDTDEFGIVTFGDLILTREGLGEYDVVAGMRNRWGDYSATVLDPTDHSRFWTFQEYASGTNQWAVNITEIRISAVPEPASAMVCGLAIGGLLLRRRRA